jgi:hypothetical protein
MQLNQTDTTHFLRGTSREPPSSSKLLEHIAHLNNAIAKDIMNISSMLKIF